MVSKASRSLLSPVEPVVEVENKVHRVQLKEACPSGDFRFIFDLGLVGDPVCDLLVAGAGGNEGFEFFGVDSGESEKDLVDRAIEVIGASGASQFCPAFIQGTGSQHSVIPKRCPWASRRGLG
jgi:hypothetical protein